MNKKTTILTALALGLTLTSGVLLQMTMTTQDVSASDPGPIVWDVMHASHPKDDDGNYLLTNYGNPINAYFVNEENLCSFYNMEPLGSIKGFEIDFKDKTNYTLDFVKKNFTISYGYTTGPWEHLQIEHDQDGWTFDETTKVATFLFERWGLSAFPNYGLISTINEYEGPSMKLTKFSVMYGNISKEGKVDCAYGVEAA